MIAYIPVVKQFFRRSFSNELVKHIYVYPVKELLRVFAIAVKWKSLVKHEEGPFCIDQINAYIDSKAAEILKKKHTQFDAVYAYEDSALATFEMAKTYKKICMYDLPIGYYKAARSLMQEELVKRPDWASTLTGFKDSDKKLNRKDQEIALADVIFVASTFTAYTLNEYYPSALPQIKIVPYGFPDTGPAKVYDYDGIRPLRILFVGGLSQRKGIADVFDALDPLKESVSFTVIGRKPTDHCIPLNEGLRKHTWIESLPHSEILKQMAVHDVLVFPSLFEGFGLVITEAMSQGTPVITTNRTIGGDFIRHEENGWLVDPGNIQSIRDCIQKIIENPEAIKNNGILARETAINRPWTIYENEMSTELTAFQKN